MSTSRFSIFGCNLCKKNIRSFQYYFTCVACKSRYHYQCINRSRQDYDNEDRSDYFCFKCLENELPFNHFNDDLDFYNALSELWYENDIDFHEFDDKVFIPFEINEHFNTNMPLCDTDPDTNFF